MPLAGGSSDKTVSKNISTCMHEGGRPQNQCIAIAYSKAGRSQAKKKDTTGMAEHQQHLDTTAAYHGDPQGCKD